MILMLVVEFAIGNPQRALATSFYITSQNYWESTNTDTPGGWPYSQASHGGSLTDNIAGASYSVQAVSSAYGYIYGGIGTVGKGAGGHHQEGWDITLQLTGDVGEEADIFIDSEVWGEVDVLVFGAARAFAVNRSTLLITNAGGTPLLDYYYTWSEDKSGAAAIIGREFDDILDSYYLGTMIVGDPTWGSITIAGNQFATATAQAYSIAFAQAEADIVSRFSFEIYSQEGTPPSEPIPEPTTMLLLSSGLIALVGFRKRIKQ